MCGEGSFLVLTIILIPACGVDFFFIEPGMAMIMANQPAVSIGMPVFNGGDFLTTTLNSLVRQTFSDYELIISDNGSTDSTQSICESFAERHTNIRYYRHAKNAGAAWNFNYVFQSACGDYFKWAAHDDILAPTCLASLVGILDAHSSVVLAYTRALLINENDEVVGLLHDGLDRRQSYASDRIRNYSPAACNPVFGLIRRSALTKTSLIGPYPSSDMILLWQPLLLGEIHEYPKVLFLRRSHPKSSVRANPDFSSRMNWFAPGRKARFYLPTANRVRRYLLAIVDSDLPKKEKMRCYSVLARRFVLHPKWVLKDFSVAVQETLGYSPMERSRNLI